MGSEKQLELNNALREAGVVFEEHAVETAIESSPTETNTQNEPPKANEPTGQTVVAQKTEETQKEPVVSPTLAELAARKKQEELARRAEKQEYRAKQEETRTQSESGPTREELIREMRGQLLSNPGKFLQENGLDRLDIAKMLLAEEAGIEVPDHLKENKRFYDIRQHQNKQNEDYQAIKQEFESFKQELVQKEQIASLRRTIDGWVNEYSSKYPYIASLAQNNKDLAISELMEEAVQAASLEGGEYLTLDDIARSYHTRIENQAKLFGFVKSQQESTRTEPNRVLVDNSLTQQSAPSKSVDEMSEEELMAKAIRDIETGAHRK